MAGSIVIHKAKAKKLDNLLRASMRKSHDSDLDLMIKQFTNLNQST